MVDLTLLFNQLQSLNIDFFTGVPDSLLNDFFLYFETNLKKNKHVIAANEGNAIAIAAGYHLATGNIPLVYMQNSGIGNAMNPLLSLTHQTVYSIPMILIMGWRGGGDSAGSDWVQHKRQGELTTVLLEDMNIPYKIVDNDNDAINHFLWAVEQVKIINSPVDLIIKKGILAKIKKEQIYQTDSILMNREEAMDIVLDYFPSDTIYLATTGRATRELHELKSKRKLPHDSEFLNVGAMGHTSSIALGIALGRPDRRVVCFDGDSAAIMHLGAFTTAGKLKPCNFLHIILNNGVHESVGGQKSAGQIADMTAIAKAAGYNTIEKPVITKQDLINTLDSLQKKDEPAFIDLHIRQGIREDIPTLNITHIEMKENLMKNLNCF
jgi:phosphonopyruvate decarboxylase